MHSDWLILGHYSSTQPSGGLYGPKNQSKKPYYKQLIDLAITWPVWQGFGLRFSWNDLTVSYC